ncbi:MAG: hypothetical protein IPK26_05965 [Planctomycetes bacterium]|nr:hypothetical protein [Planctomycetota bacterium]
MPASPSRWLCVPALGTLLAWTGLPVLLVLTLAFREPYSDQWRQQFPLLNGSFPGSVLQLESGHRQVLPNLVRLADLHWTGGSGELLAWTGASLFALTLLLAWRLLRRAPRPPAANRCLALTFLGLGVGFLAQARMLLHPNESVQLGGVWALLLLALHLLLTAASWRNLALALLCATAATFCFGTGFAVHAAILALLVLLRRSIWQLLVAGLSAFAVLYLYRHVLPGEDGIAANTPWAPADLAANLPRWLAAPFVQAFFGLADPSFQAGIADAVAERGPHGALLVGAARVVAAPLGPERTMHVAAAVAGVAGLLLLLRACWRTFVRARGPLDEQEPIRRFGLGLALFATAAGGLVCVARTEFFAATPGQLFAERYLVWSGLFWSGLAIHSLAGAERPRTVALGTLAAALIALTLWPVQRSWMSWGVATKNQVERTALALRLGIDDKATAPMAADLGALSFAQCVHAVRERRLQMFAEPELPAIGTTLATDPPDASLPELPARLQPVTAQPTLLHAAVDLPAPLLTAAGQEWPILDARGAVVGRLRADESSALWRRLPQPLVSRRGNLYLLATAATGPCHLVTTTAPHVPLAILR